MNEDVSKFSINKKINSKILSYKEDFLTNIKDRLSNIIFIGNTKIIKHSSQFLTQSEIQADIQMYNKEIESDKTKINEYNEIIINMSSQIINHKFNCMIENVTRDYIFEKYESKAIHLKYNADIEYLNQNNLITKKDKKVTFVRKSQTFNPNSFNIHKNNSDIFSVDKSRNIKINLEDNLVNLMLIQDNILKSLSFYNEDFLKLIREKKGFTRRHVNFNREKTRRFKITGNFKKLLKKNSFKVLPFSEATIKRSGERRTGSILNFDTIKKNIRIQSILKGEPRESNFSLLKQKENRENQIFFF